MSETIKRNQKKRIFVVGSSNTGKTSILNELTQQNHAVNSAAIGTTFDTDKFEPTIRKEIQYDFFDTAGLNETNAGTVTNEKARLSITKLLQHSIEGFNMMILVVRIGAITIVDKLNYQMMKDLIGKSKIPMACVITGCENEDPLEKYAIDNKKFYELNEMYFTEIISTCFAKGGKIEPIYAPLRKQSAEIVWGMIERKSSEEPIVCVNIEEFFNRFQKLWNSFCVWVNKPTWKFIVNNADLIEILERMGITDQKTRDEMAQNIMEKI